MKNISSVKTPSPLSNFDSYGLGLISFLLVACLEAATPTPRWSNRKEILDCKSPSAIECQSPEIAQLIFTMGYQFLMETLELDDEMFEAIYGINVGSEAKTVFAKKLAHHYSGCSHCQFLNGLNDEEDLVVEDFLNSVATVKKFNGLLTGLPQVSI